MDSLENGADRTDQRMWEIRLASKPPKQNVLWIAGNRADKCGFDASSPGSHRSCPNSTDGLVFELDEDSRRTPLREWWRHANYRNFSVSCRDEVCGTSIGRSVFLGSSAEVGKFTNRESEQMTEQKATNITWHEHHVSKAEREQLKGQRGAVLWFTGLSACGKSTVANTVDHLLAGRSRHSYVLDGDNIRHGLNKNLGFSPEDRTENIRRIGEVANLFCDAGLLTLTAFISPYRADRDKVRELLDDGAFIEIYVNASLETCEKRDPKGLYQKARAGEIKGFTGIDAPYEAPENPELVLDADNKGIDELAAEVVAYLEENGFLSLPA